MQNTDNQFDAFLSEPRGDRVFRIQISRNTLIAIIVSLLIHAIILFSVFPQFEQEQATELPARELEVSLAPPQIQAPAPIAEAKPAVEVPIELAEPPKIIAQKPRKSPTKPVFKVPEVLTQKAPAPEALPPKPSEPPPKPTENLPTDMMAYVNQQRAKRGAAESDAARQNAEATAKEQGPSAEQTRDANIKRNFQTGVNGIFEITSLSSRSATFAFRGWTGDFGNSRKEFFEIEANASQDVRLLMIKKMISLIRQHYQGDFNWESQRLGRTLVMSARPEDNSGLEDFLMIEFFGQQYKTAL